MSYEKNLKNLNLKWGEDALKMGWTAIPTSIFFAQKSLDISPLAFNVLCQIMIHWWDKNSWPHPSQQAISIRMGVSVRTVQRGVTELKIKNLIEVQPTGKGNNKYRGRNIYILDKLITRLNELTPNLNKKINPINKE